MLWKKPGSQALMGAMVRTLLGLLLASVGATQDGELCLGWHLDPVEGFLPFHCPQRPDRTDGPFCCGTCNEPYCCNSEEDRLDQDMCLRVWRMLHLFFRAMMAQRTTFTLPTSDPQMQEVKSTWSPSKAELTGAMITAIACGVIAFLVLLSMFLCKCCPSVEDYEICRRVWRGEDTPPPSPWETPYINPLREETRAALLRAFEESLSNLSAASRAMDGATAGPRRWAHTVRGPEQAARQAPPTSGATSGTAAAGEVTPELGAAAGGEDPPVQGAAGGGEATSPPVPPAAGPISA